MDQLLISAVSQVLDLGLQFKKDFGPQSSALAGANVMYATTKNLRISERPWNTIG